MLFTLDLPPPLYTSKLNNDIVFGYHPFICTMQNKIDHNLFLKKYIHKLTNMYFFKTKNVLISSIPFFQGGLFITPKNIAWTHFPFDNYRST